jgi:hypothetical protein
MSIGQVALVVFILFYFKGWLVYVVSLLDCCVHNGISNTVTHPPQRPPSLPACVSCKHTYPYSDNCGVLSLINSRRLGLWVIWTAA